jgi:hypothetical protein
MEMHDLLRVVTVLRGAGPLYKQLHQFFNADYPPTALHSFLASLLAVLRQKGYPSYPLIVTTNYDDVLEHAFWNAREPLDLVYYIAVARDRGKFIHSLLNPAAATDPSIWPPEVKPILISKPNEYSGLSLKHRAVIFENSWAPLPARVPSRVVSSLAKTITLTVSPARISPIFRP